MRGLVLLVVVVGVVAGQDQPQLNEGEQQFQKVNIQPCIIRRPITYSMIYGNYRSNNARFIIKKNKKKKKKITD